MARFQTRLAELLEKETGDLPEYAKLSYRKLGEMTGVSGPTLKAWYDARVGSQTYLERLEGDVLGKLMAFFKVSMDELVVVIPNGDENPQFSQRTASRPIYG